MFLRYLTLLCLSTALLNAQSLNLSDSSPRIDPAALPLPLPALPSPLPQTDIFPRPNVLLPSISFWKRIYGELTSNQIVFSDSEDLGLVYHVINVPSAGKARDQAIRKNRLELEIALQELELAQPTSEEGLSNLAKEVYWALHDNKRPDKYRRGQHIRAQNGLKNQFEDGYKRSGAHEQEIKSRLKKAGLPEELIGIVFVESLFHPKSLSSVGAKGIWQFMKRTAYEFMRVNKLVDERLDPILSTDAAIKYIKSAKESLKEWPLAITSYNYGRGGMAKAVEMTGTRDFGEILKKYQNPRFGFAARNYYAEFLAAVDIYKQAESLFPQTEPISSWAYEIIQLPKPISVSDLLSMKYVETVWFKTHNPALIAFAHHGKQILPKGFTLRVPSEDREKLEKKLARISNKHAQKTKNKNMHFTELPKSSVVPE